MQAGYCKTCDHISWDFILMVWVAPGLLLGSPAGSSPQLHYSLGSNRGKISEKVGSLETPVYFQGRKDYPHSEHSVKYANLFYVLVLSSQDCKDKVGTYPEGLSVGRGCCLEKTISGQLVYYMSSKKERGFRHKGSDQPE